MLISIIIPTRKRLAGLRKTLASLRGTVIDPNRLEIVLKIDDDDAETLKAISGLESEFGVTVVISPRGNGYNDMGRFMTEGCAAASGTWVMMMDDDSTIEGAGWDVQLAAIIPERNVAQPEFYQLGLSKYGSNSCGPCALIVPRNCWQLHGERAITPPTDEFLRGLLITQNNYTKTLLRGMTYNHQRGEESELAEHKKL